MNFLYFLIAAAVAIALFQFLRIALKAYFKWHGKRVVTCPETGKPAGVEVDAKFAAVTTVLNEPNIALQNCSRWPERENCGQACLQQLQASPDDCLLRNILQGWFDDKSCVYCRKHFAEIRWHDHKPAFRSPDSDFVEWVDLPVERIDEILATHDPVCWNCFIAENFRKQFPDLVTDRPARKRLI